MPIRLIDVQCPACGGIRKDVMLRNGEAELPNCEYPGPITVTTVNDKGVEETHTPPCGAQTARVYLPTNRSTVIGDDIPGGVDIRHGLCNADGTPRRYYSHTEIRREAKRRSEQQGIKMENIVRHVPRPGTDKSRHTVRWDAAAGLTPEQEAARINAWWAEEAKRPDGLRREDFLGHSKKSWGREKPSETYEAVAEAVALHHSIHGRDE